MWLFFIIPEIRAKAVFNKLTFKTMLLSNKRLQRAPTSVERHDIVALIFRFTQVAPRNADEGRSKHLSIWESQLRINTNAKQRTFLSHPVSPSSLTGAVINQMLASVHVHGSLLQSVPVWEMEEELKEVEADV